MTADRHRRRVRVTAEALVPGMRVQPWNQRDQPRRTVKRTVVGDVGSGVAVLFTDGHAAMYRRWAVFHALAAPTLTSNFTA